MLAAIIYAYFVFALIDQTDGLMMMAHIKN
jgi:hypothetical protein